MIIKIQRCIADPFLYVTLAGHGYALIALTPHEGTDDERILSPVDRACQSKPDDQCGADDG